MPAQQKRDQNRTMISNTGETGVMTRRWWTRLGLLTAVAGLAASTLVAGVHGGTNVDVALGDAGAAERMPTWSEAEAAAAAKVEGKRVEVGSHATAQQVTFAHSDGTFTRETHAQPFRVVKGGRWVDIDTTLVRSGGHVGPKAASTAMSFSGGGDGPLATITRAGRVMKLSWPAPLPAPVLSGDTATYRDVLKDVDLVVRVTATGFSHVLVVKTPQAAKLPQITDIAYGLSGELLTFTVSPDGGLSARDTGSGGLVFESPTPMMWEAPVSGDDADPVAEIPDSSKRAELDARVDGKTLRLTPDTTLLTGADTRFPLYIDPFINPTSNTDWAMIDSGYPNDEYWRFAADQRVGLCPSACEESKIKRLFFVLPTPYQDNTISVLDAAFKITMVHVYNSTPQNVALYRTGGVSSATNWSNQPGGAGWAGSVHQDTIWPTVTQGSCTPYNQNVSFNATAAAREAATDDWSHTTFGIKASNEGNSTHVKRFCGNAVLSVHYNRAPSTPTSLVSNPGGVCKTGTSRPFVSSIPTLSAYLADPDNSDGEPLAAEFSVAWTANGVPQSKAWQSGQKSNGSTFDYNLAAAGTGVPNLPEYVVVYWNVRASDGTSWGPSSPTCEFILDRTKPTGPDIDSEEYLPLDEPNTSPDCVVDAAWRDGVGRYGTFTFDSKASDVVSYSYGFDTNPTPANIIPANGLGGPASVRWLATSEGTHSISVVAIDGAGQQSDTSTCNFSVAGGSLPVGEWRLADPPGTTQAADERATNPAAAGTAVTFGQPGPAGPAHPSVALDGSPNAYLVTNTLGLVDTSKPFAVALWVKLNDTSRTQTVLSQDGTGEHGFSLDYYASSNMWSFQIPTSDVTKLGSWAVTAPAVADRWTHLTASYDTIADQLTLTVNGQTTTTSAGRSQWASHGNLQIGRRVTKTGYNQNFNGGIADVQVFNRLLPAAEALALATHRLKRVAYWPLDTATIPDDNASIYISPEAADTDPPTKNMTLANGASPYIPDPLDPIADAALVGAGHVILDGADDYASSTAQLAGQSGSFSISARVRLAADCANEQVVLSQPGANVSRFKVRCVTVGGGMRWQLVLAHTDAVGTAETVVTDGEHLPSPSEGQHLAVSYDAATKVVRLYVAGQLAASATAAHPTVWTGADNGIQLGRAKLNSGVLVPTYGGYFAGVIDDVRVYTGVFDQVTVTRLASPTPQSDL